VKPACAQPCVCAAIAVQEQGDPGAAGQGDLLGCVAGGTGQPAWDQHTAASHAEISVTGSGCCPGTKPQLSAKQL